MATVELNAGDAPRSPQPIKRAAVVYGKRSTPLPPPSTVIPVDVRQQSSGHSRVRGPAVPSQRRLVSPPKSVNASDSERCRSPDAVDPFQFGFRHRLKELDEEFNNYDAQSPRTGLSPSREGQVKDPQNVSMGTTVLSSEPRRSSGEHSSASSSPPPASSHSTPARERPHELASVHRRVRRVTNRGTSDSEPEGQSNSSSVSPVQHAITTPHSRSSPTPPTSSEVPMGGRKTKGKAPARDALPLLFDDERSLATGLSAKPKKGKRSETSAHSKTKAPTKKERREAAFESSRIAANRPAEVTRTQEQKHSLSAFFASLRRDNFVTPTLGAELPSDPIEKFSSPTDNTMRAPPPNCTFGGPSGLLGTLGTSNQPSSSQRAKELPPAAGDSDDEMPSVASIIQQENGKWQRLQTMKRVALQLADTSKTFDINSEDDLLIVKDDMHAVAREEAVQRRLDKVHGSPVKDMVTLRRINHPSVRPAIVSPHKLSKRELQELAKPSFARVGKGSKGLLTKNQLDQLMMMQHTAEQLRSIKRHEEEWVQGGGRLSRDTGDDKSQISLSKKLEAYAELGLKIAETGGTAEDETSVDGSDEDYTPRLRSKSMDVDEHDGEPGDSMEVSQLPQSQVYGDEDEDEDEDSAPVRRNKSGRRHARVVLGSDDEREQPTYNCLPSVQRDSVSSMESQTEDENDKENSAKLMYDRSEDKENKAVVRHDLSSSEGAFRSRPSTLHGFEDGVRGNLSLAVADDFDDTSSLKGDVRLPLKDISKDEDDLFLSSPSANSPFTERLLHGATISSPHPSASTLNLGSPPILRSERIGQTNYPPLDSENDENNPSGLGSLQPSFLESIRNQTRPGPQPSFNPLPNDGFSQLFSAEEQGLTQPAHRVENDELLLTLDVGLKPALEVSGTVRLQAETIFEKEQEYVVAAQQKDRPKELLYVNDYGFLTQTCPEGSNPQVYHMTPSQASKLVGTQVLNATQTQPLSARLPLRTLSFTVSQRLSPESQPLRRLRKRSPSPLEQKFNGRSGSLGSKSNAFDILGKTPKPPSKTQEKHGKSEFVVVEAEESDEDDMFGFGGTKKDDDEEDDNDQDKVVEGLVDDTTMDAETEAADLVLEKHREHEEEDDQRLQKLHQDATEGKFRMKRRDRGVGFEDDSDEDDDDDARRTRQRIYKKRKIEGDSLEALGQNEDTKAFYNTYHQDLVDEDDDFEHLREYAITPAEDDDISTKPREQETVSTDEIRQRVREMAQSDLEVEVLNPEDTSWIDQSMMVEVDDVVRVKVLEYRRSGSTSHHPSAGRTDFDLEQSKGHVEDEQERKQLTSWAKNQSRWRQGTGRSGNSAAVTGHTKVKAGGGSLRSMQQSDASRVSETRKTQTSSLLSRVSPRKNRFK